jgi:tetratricopeptide (TPR) repeat protein
MGWLMLALIGIAAALALWLGGVARSLWTFAGAAMMLGATGYALQGRATLPGHPVASNAEPIEVDPAMVELRDSMLGRFTADGAYLIAADGMTRSGDTKSAVQWAIAGTNKYPRSIALWTGLGSALQMHDGTVSPATLLAFKHAAQLNPRHPAPPYYLGLAYIRSGDYAAARPYWARALALSPPDRSYRKEIAFQLGRLDLFLAAAERAQTPGAPQE